MPLERKQRSRSCNIAVPAGYLACSTCVSIVTEPWGAGPVVVPIFQMRRLRLIECELLV